MSLRFIVLLITGSFLLTGTQAQTTIPMAKLDTRSGIFPGENIPIPSKFDQFPLVEPSVAAHPSDPQKLVTAAMVVTDIQRPYESCRLSSFFSNDGGNTWKETTHNFWGYDPWVAILTNGQTAMSWLGTSGNFQHQFPLQIFTSSVGGEQWNTKVQQFNGKGHGHDGTKLVGLNNDFYLTTVRFNGDMSADVVLFHSSGDGGFKEVAAVPGNGRRLNFCEPGILKNGQVVIPTSYHSEKIWVHIYDPEENNLSGPITVSHNPKVGRGYMRMAVDHSESSLYRDHVYLVRAVADGSSSKGVWLNQSKDGGKTWIAEHRVDLFETDRTSKANVASVAVNKDGVVGVSWMDGQQDPAQRKYELYFTISLDGGEHFQRPMKISEVSSDPRTTTNGDVANKFIGGGHYLGITAKADGNFQLVWSDSRSGLFKLQTCEVEIKDNPEN